jgi:hypothetical protein
MKTFVSLVAVWFAALVVSLDSQSNGNPNGRDIFRYDTFGDEQLWTGVLHMPQALAGVSPALALEVGLKVDVDALPRPIIAALSNQTVDLNDPAVTLELLTRNAVVGVIGTVGAGGELESVGITCALCHSSVDDSLAPGIGRRLDGWPNRDLNVGAIIALSPVLDEAKRAVFNSWGPGMFDPRLQAFDGQTLIELNPTTRPVVIPPAYGLQGVPFETFTGDGPISYWNNYVGVSQMGGHGSFSDPRINLTISQSPDLVTPKLPELLDYQLRLRTPAPPRGSYDRAAARRGERLFNGSAQCATCHTGPTFTDVGNGPDPGVPLLHAPGSTGTETEYASRSATKAYRTEPLRGLWQHPPYFHDGSAADLPAVVDRYDTFFGLGLSVEEKADLVEFLKSL